MNVEGRLSNMKEQFKELTQKSYYNWDGDFNQFVEKIIKKSSNINLKEQSDY